MKHFLLIICASMFSIFVFTDKVSNTIATKQTEEQIYLQTDRAFYKPGEDIWFSAWTVDRNVHCPSEISDIIYVDLINPNGKVEKTLRLLSLEGRSNGDFHLADESPGGIYKLRAYSLWMKNIAEDNYFEKEITVQKVMLPNLLMKLKRNFLFEAP
ncbi:MAG: MG2 domain-containing protein [Bacteroidales bacterium]|nr:MG2 domain-containing protein [Bacteroidales bacterium]